jgi:hypothetical protein
MALCVCGNTIEHSQGVQDLAHIQAVAYSSANHQHNPWVFMFVDVVYLLWQICVSIENL